MMLPSEEIEFTCCTTRRLPEHLQMKAAWAAVVARPSNDAGLIDVAYSLPHDEPLPPQSIALLKGKFWPNASQIRVAFSGGNSATNSKVLQYASLWSKWANLDFIDVGRRDPWDILVGYDQPGYWSMVGTDSKFAKQQGGTSLNLQGFDSGRMPASEWMRVVPHEFGHALGAMHEQMRPDIIALLDPAGCYAEFGRTQGWSRQEINAQILTPLDMSRVIASPWAEVTSIMMYAFSAACTKNRKPIAGGDHITDLDGQTMAQVYPGRGNVHPAVTSTIGAL